MTAFGALQPDVTAREAEGVGDQFRHQLCQSFARLEVNGRRAEKGTLTGA